MQKRRDYYRYFLLVSSEPLIAKMIVIPAVYITTLTNSTVMFCNQMMTQQKKSDLPNLMVYKA